MKPEEVQEKVDKLISPCECGSGKMRSMCCGKDEVVEVAEEICPCGSGKQVKDCCMKRQEAHQDTEETKIPQEGE